MSDTRPDPAERDHAEALLDEALEESFPASDPIAVPTGRDTATPRPPTEADA